jgi:Chaperonin GroEL (HSP60 family)
MAACSIANIVKSSLGPVGLDKMLVDDIGVSIIYNLHFIHKNCTKLFY